MIKFIEENDFFLVLCKPTGVTVHNEEPSLFSLLSEQKKPTQFVNRLDKETSGLMVVAKSPQLHTELSKALINGQKKYRTLLRGEWKNNLTGQWSWSLTDKSEGRNNPRGLSKDRIDCLTEYQVVQTNRYITEMLCTLHTGRQHQIRKHACLAGHPIVGDPRYNEKKYNEMIADRYKTNRMWLHAELLEFEFRGKKMNFLSLLDLSCMWSD